ncbi:TPA: hypothetical protein SAY52_003839 [Burkholderia cenocepacia]|uniref:hypothetical protein n=1 Tax=unclassified Burkholderia TaxID=2613784 RepID=UPI00158CF1F9|nr:MULTISPECIES: hypothetical protein [unclassified Burkholderia]HEF5873193.1 hypothetical protein [Burkholderia cenocepacia]
MTRGDAAVQRRIARSAMNDIRRPGFDTDSGRRFVCVRWLFSMILKWHAPFQSIAVEFAAIFVQASA